MGSDRREAGEESGIDAFVRKNARARRSIETWGKIRGASEENTKKTRPRHQRRTVDRVVGRKPHERRRIVATYSGKRGGEKTRQTWLSKGQPLPHRELKEWWTFKAISQPPSHRERNHNKRKM